MVNSLLERCLGKILGALATHTRYWLIFGLAGLVYGGPVAALSEWPGESISAAENLTAIEGPQDNDFHADLSAAVWNPVTRTLWLGRNGPGGANSKLWAVIEDGAGSFTIDSRAGNRGEWTGFGDLEGVTQANFSEDVVFLLIEGEERIKEYDISTYGVAIETNSWNTRPFLPLLGGAGAEGITFVPSSFLSAAGFVDQNGNIYSSTQGMDGLMFVGHQNGGAIYVFDLNRASGNFVFVGKYLTGQNDTSGLEFDRSTGQLYLWHDGDIDLLSISDLTSTPVAGLTRQFNIVKAYRGPAAQNNEGIAIFPAEECEEGSRSFFMTIDDGGDSALRWYREFKDGCHEDGDSDTVPDTIDNCPLISNLGQADSNQDGVGNACDLDADGIRGNIDNCPLTSNFNQLDSDNDGTGDACADLPPGCG